MRMIGQLDSETDAKRFSDYLLTQNIDAHIEESASGAWQVWIEHDDDLDKGVAEFDAFRSASHDPKYGDARSTAEKIRRDEEKAAERRRKNYRDVRTSQTFSGLMTRPTPVAIVLIAVSVLVYFLQQYDDGQHVQRTENYLLFQSELVEAEWQGDVYQIARPNPEHSMYWQVAQGQVWRIFTPMFLHFGVLHILFNMMWMWQLGRVIEAIKGSGFFIILVVVVAFVSHNAQALWDQYYAGMNGFGGMSGVVAGVFGYAWMKSRLQPYEGVRINDQAVGLMIGWLVICSFGWVGPIANAAHWGGLFAGMAIGAGPTLWRRLRRA